MAILANLIIRVCFSGLRKEFQFSFSEEALGYQHPHFYCEQQEHEEDTAPALVQVALADEMDCCWEICPHVKSWQGSIQG